VDDLKVIKINKKRKKRWGFWKNEYFLYPF
jgi:hypothetical protein